MVHGGNLLRSDNCGFATYECRTVYDVELADNQWKRAEQSMACRTRENQLLTKQRDEARERIKRLEEDLMDAKNQYAALVADVALYEDRGVRIKRLEEALDEVYHAGRVGAGLLAKKAWHKAKEAKL
jgi:DNA-binding transcriptional MerR regulator